MTNLDSDILYRSRKDDSLIPMSPSDGTTALKKNKQLLQLNSSLFIPTSDLTKHTPSPLSSSSPNYTILTSSLSLFPPSAYIKADDLIIEEEIGAGDFGVVYKGHYKDIPVAVKCIKLLPILSKSTMTIEQLAKHKKTMEARVESLTREAQILHSLPKSPNVIDFLGISIRQGNLAIVTSYCKYGNLEQAFIASHPKRSLSPPPIPLNQRSLINFALQAAKGLSHLHSHSVIHQDIAARNYLLNDNLQLMVSDFGLSRVLTPLGSAVSKSDLHAWKWSSPEVLLERKFTAASDCFSFAVSVWELFARRAPFLGIPSFRIPMMVAVNRERERIDQSWPHIIQQLLAMCWHQRAEDRPPLTTIVAMIEDALGNVDISDDVIPFHQSQHAALPPPPSQAAISNLFARSSVVNSNGLDPNRHLSNHSSFSPSFIPNSSTSNSNGTSGHLSLPPPSSPSYSTYSDVFEQDHIVRLAERQLKLNQTNHTLLSPQTSTTGSMNPYDSPFSPLDLSPTSNNIPPFQLAQRDMDYTPAQLSIFPNNVIPSTYTIPQLPATSFLLSSPTTYIPLQPASSVFPTAQTPSYVPSISIAPTPSSKPSIVARAPASVIIPAAAPATAPAPRRFALPGTVINELPPSETSSTSLIPQASLHYSSALAPRLSSLSLSSYNISPIPPQLQLQTDQSKLRSKKKMEEASENGGDGVAYALPSSQSTSNDDIERAPNKSGGLGGVFTNLIAKILGKKEEKPPEQGDLNSISFMGFSPPPAAQFSPSISASASPLNLSSSLPSPPPAVSIEPSLESAVLVRRKSIPRQAISVESSPNDIDDKKSEVSEPIQPPPLLAYSASEPTPPPAPYASLISPHLISTADLVAAAGGIPSIPYQRSRYALPPTIASQSDPIGSKREVKKKKDKKWKKKAATDMKDQRNDIIEDEYEYDDEEEADEEESSDESEESSAEEEFEDQDAWMKKRGVPTITVMRQTEIESHDKDKDVQYKENYDSEDAEEDDGELYSDIYGDLEVELDDGRAEGEEKNEELSPRTRTRSDASESSTASTRILKPTCLTLSSLTDLTRNGEILLAKYKGHKIRGLQVEEEELTEIKSELPPHNHVLTFDYLIEKNDKEVEEYVDIQPPLAFVQVHKLRNNHLLAYLRTYAHNIPKANIIKFALDISLGLQHFHTYLPHHPITPRTRTIFVSSDGHVQVSLPSAAHLLHFSREIDEDTAARYSAPESIEYGIVDERSDVWQFGLILYEIAMRGKELVYEKILNEKYQSNTAALLIGISKGDVTVTCSPSMKESLGSDYCGLIEECLSRDSNKRPQLNQIVQQLQSLRKKEKKKRVSDSGSAMMNSNINTGDSDNVSMTGGRRGRGDKKDEKKKIKDKDRRRSRGKRSIGGGSEKGKGKGSHKTNRAHRWRG